MPTMLLRAFAVWLIIMLAETVHGILRGVILVPAVGDRTSRQFGVFIGSAIIFAIAYIFIDWFGRDATISRLLLIGFLWVIATVVFEFALGRLLGLSWDRLLEDYRLAEGGLMPIGLVLMFLSPLLAKILRSRSP